MKPGRDVRPVASPQVTVGGVSEAVTVCRRLVCAAKSAAKPLDASGPGWTAAATASSARALWPATLRQLVNDGSVRARRVPDRAANRGEPRSLADKLIRPPS
jgi:hypothetical protein